MFNDFVRKVKWKIMERLIANLPDYNERISYYHLKTIHTAFFNYGACDEIMNHFALIEKSHWEWQHGHNHQWLVYMAALLEKGDEAKAKSILRTYYSVHGLKDIHRIMPVAKFASENRYTNDDIEKTAFIYDTFRSNIDNDLFRKYLSGKSIAVVGNGPQETGKGKGKDIDRHDVVIRLNLFKTDGYEEDYGSKINIWAKGARLLVEAPDEDKLNFVIYAHIYNRLILRDDQIDLMYKDCVSYPDKIVYRYHDVDWPEYFNATTGCRVLNMLYKELGTLENVDVYGMSFPYDADTDMGYYFNVEVDSAKAHRAHNMYVELAFTRDLYYRKGNGKPADDIRLDEIFSLDNNY